MKTVSLEQAQTELPALVRGLFPGQDVAITDGGKVIARLVSAAAVRHLGTLAGTVPYMAPDFDAPLDDFKEYTE